MGQPLADAVGFSTAYKDVRYGYITAGPREDIKYGESLFKRA